MANWNRFAMSAVCAGLLVMGAAGAQPCRGEVTIDGYLQDGEWRNDLRIDDRNDSDWTELNELRYLNIQWDASNLYIGMTGVVYSNSWLIYIDVDPGSGNGPVDLTAIDVWERGTTFGGSGFAPEFQYGCYQHQSIYDSDGFWQILSSTSTMDRSGDIDSAFDSFHDFGLSGGSELAIPWSVLYENATGTVPVSARLAVVAAICWDPEPAGELGGDSIPSNIAAALPGIDNFWVIDLDHDGDGEPDAFPGRNLIGKLVAWGDNAEGQCDPPEPDGDFIAIAAGGEYSLGLRCNGSIVGWGNDLWGQCTVPGSNTDFTALATSQSIAPLFQSIGLKDDGAVAVWGYDAGLPSPNSGFVDVAAGGYHYLGLKADGSVVAWGANGFGQCDVPEPNTGFVDIAGGDLFSLGLKSDGSIVGWGDNGGGVCTVPEPNEDFVAVSAGTNHSLGLKSDGTLVVWGDNGHGQCDVPEPNTGFVAADGNMWHSLGLKADGNVLAWGDNSRGQCDVPELADRYRAVSAGWLHSLALAESRVPVARITITSPSGPEATLWDTPRQEEISWTFEGQTEPDHWSLSYSTDGGIHYRAIHENVEFASPPYAFTWSVPPISTSRAKIRIQALDAGETVLAEAETGDALVLYNKHGIHFVHGNGVNGGEETSDTAAVLTWPAVPNDGSYEVTVSRASGTTCSNGYFFKIYPPLGADPDTGEPPTFFEIPWEDYATLPAAGYDYVVARYVEGLGFVPFHTGSFVVCKLGDLDPFDTEDKKPVILVHGWTSDSSTWYVDDSSALVEGLVAGDGSQPSKRHPWTFEYPNIGGIRVSGAALGEAIAYIGGLSDAPTVSLVAHSMGGLVSRAYLQSEARTPSDAVYPDFRDDVDILVTLSTPHLGTSQARKAAYFKGLLPWVCDGAYHSDSVADLSEENSTFIADLSGHDLPAGLGYLLAAGTKAFDQALPEERYHILKGNCDYGNDGTVDVCNATGGYCDGDYEHGPLGDGTAPVEYRQYPLSHGRMSKPGYYKTGEPQERIDAASGLLSDVLRVCRYGPDPMASDPCVVPVEATATFECQTTPAFLPLKAVSVNSSKDQPLSGARIVVQHVEDAGSPGGLACATGANGQITLALEPGEYAISISAPGTEPRQETLVVADPPQNIHWTLGIVTDPGTSVPINPTVLVDGGSASTPDSTVAVDLACDNATDYMISEVSDFRDGAWAPLAGPVPWSFDGTPGLKVLHAVFRNAAGEMSNPVSTSIILSGAQTGAITVESNPPGYPVVLNGSGAPVTSPATFDGLSSGFYDLSLVAPGMLVDPASATVEVVPGGATSVSFDVTAAPAPGPVDLATLGDSDYLSGEPLSWLPPSGEARFYNVTISEDSLRQAIVWQRIGAGSPAVALDCAIPDSAAYYVAIESVGEQGAVQTGDVVSRAFLLDHTPPVLEILSPSPGDTLFPGDELHLASAVQDWGGLDELIAVLSPDGGRAYPDTLWSGGWANPIYTTVPVYGLADNCLIAMSVTDLAGNRGLAVSDSFLVIHDGVTAVPEQDPVSRFSFRIIGGNPRSADFRMAVEVPGGSHARVAVYDLRGQRIRTLLDAPLPSGRRDVDWDGRDAGGRRMAAGVYLVCLENRGNVAVRKIALVR